MTLLINHWTESCTESQAKKNRKTQKIRIRFGSFLHLRKSRSDTVQNRENQKRSTAETPKNANASNFRPFQRLAPTMRTRKTNHSMYLATKAAVLDANCSEELQIHVSVEESGEIAGILHTGKMSPEGRRRGREKERKKEFCLFLRSEVCFFLLHRLRVGLDPLLFIVIFISVSIT